MDTAWYFRSAYDEARKIRNAQDEYCRKAEAGEWDYLKGQEFPDSLQWEVLVDVLRGRVKVFEHPDGNCECSLMFVRSQITAMRLVSHSPTKIVWILIRSCDTSRLR